MKKMVVFARSIFSERSRTTLIETTKTQPLNQKIRGDLLSPLFLYFLYQFQYITNLFLILKIKNEGKK